MRMKLLQLDSTLVQVRAQWTRIVRGKLPNSKLIINEFISEGYKFGDIDVGDGCWRKKLLVISYHLLGHGSPPCEFSNVTCRVY